eukprot:g2594.t1
MPGGARKNVTRAMTVPVSKVTETEVNGVRVPVKRVGACRKCWDISGKWVKLILPLALITICGIVAVQQLSSPVLEACKWMQDNKPGSLFLYVLLFTLWVTVCLSQSILTLASGYIYGFWLGWLISTVGMFFAVVASLIIVRLCIDGVCRKKEDDLQVNRNTTTVNATIVDENINSNVKLQGDVSNSDSNRYLESKSGDVEDISVEGDNTDNDNDDNKTLFPPPNPNDTWGDVSSLSMRTRMRRWLIGKFDSIRVFEKMMTGEDARPFYAILMIRLTYVPTFAKNYGLAVLDAPVFELLSATTVSAIYACGVFSYIGSAMSSLVEAIGASDEPPTGPDGEPIKDDTPTKNPAANLIKYIPMVSGLVLSVVMICVIKRQVKLEVKKAKIEEEERERARWAAEDEAKNAMVITQSNSHPEIGVEVVEIQTRRSNVEGVKLVT